MTLVSRVVAVLVHHQLRQLGLQHLQHLQLNVALHFDGQLGSAFLDCKLGALLEDKLFFLFLLSHEYFAFVLHKVGCVGARSRVHRHNACGLLDLEQFLIFESLLPVLVVAVHSINHDVVHCLEIGKLRVQSPVHQTVFKHLRRRGDVDVGDEEGHAVHEVIARHLLHLYLAVLILLLVGAISLCISIAVAFSAATKCLFVHCEQKVRRQAKAQCGCFLQRQL
mmetsp:Transcript_6547/g.11006  ORF Transcript_6547/g.11006 Transcript_6547/m.11006 type:complete len:223 (-) Transcript_6547:1634-2302(-)